MTKAINVFIDFPVTDSNVFKGLRMPQTLYNYLKTDPSVNIVSEKEPIDIILAFNGGSHYAHKNTPFYARYINRRRLAKIFPIFKLWPKIKYDFHLKPNLYFEKRIKKLQTKNPNAKLILRVDDRYKSLCKVYGYDDTIRHLLSEADLCIHQNKYCQSIHEQPMQTIFGTLKPVQYKKATIIENPVDPDLFSPDGPQKNLPGKTRILHVSATGMVRKGLGTVLQIATILKDNVDIQFILVGKQDQDPIYGPDIKKFDNVHHYPFTDDCHELASYYRACDLLLFPSINDCSPNTVLESMSCGTPVVGVESGGLPELLLKGDVKGGLLINDQNPIYAIKEVLANQEAFSRNAIKIATTFHHRDVIGKRYVDVFRNLMSDD